MTKRSSQKKRRSKPVSDTKQRSKRYSPAEIFMAVLGAALIIMFGVIILVSVLG